MTGVQALEAGRRAYEAVAAGSADATPARPERASITMRTKPDEARPHLFTPEKGRSKGRVIGQQISILPPLIRLEDLHPHEVQARPSLLWQIGNRSHETAANAVGDLAFSYNEDDDKDCIGY